MHLPVERTNALVERLEQIVLRKIAGDSLALPVMPVVAEKCLRVLEDDSAPQKKLLGILEQDPMLAATIMRKSQAALFGPGKVNSLAAAVSRLGSQTLKAALIEECAKKVFASREPRIAAALQGLWEHSVAVAMLSRDLVALVQANVDPDSAYLSGLLHDIGKPTLAAMLLEAEKGLVTADGAWIEADQWIGSVQRHHRKVGVALAEKWQLPDEITAGIRDIGAYDASKPNTIANFVRFTNALAKREGLAIGPHSSRDTTALIDNGRALLGLEQDLVAGLVSQLRDRLQSQHAA